MAKDLKQANVVSVVLGRPTCRRRNCLNGIHVTTFSCRCQLPVDGPKSGPGLNADTLSRRKCYASENERPASASGSVSQLRQLYHVATLIRHLFHLLAIDDVRFLRRGRFALLRRVT